MTDDLMHQLALRGAKTRLDEIMQEMATIVAAFPALDGHTTSVTPTKTKRIEARVEARGRKQMSRAARAAVSLRMKRYWKAQRAARGSSNGSSARA